MGHFASVTSRASRAARSSSDSWHEASIKAVIASIITFLIICTSIFYSDAKIEKKTAKM
jgi:hypothetical protein